MAAILQLYLARSGLGGSVAAAETLLLAAIDQLAEEQLLASLHEGFCGVAWAIEHASHLAPEIADPSWNDGLDDVLGDLVALPHANADLVYGLAGIGIYGLERGDRGSARRWTRAIIDQLDRMAQPGQRGGRCWPAFGKTGTVSFQIDFGMAHGTPGPIGFLAGAIFARFEHAALVPLLRDAVEALLAWQLEDGGFAMGVPVARDEGMSRARTAWCYGDPGVASALLLAARAAGYRGWEEQAVAVARAACRRPAIETGVLDAAFCHGSAGLAHIYNRLGQETGDAELCEAARGWYLDTLDRGARGILEDELFKRSFLSGTLGIGLSLLAAVTDVAPDWDRVAALSSAGGKSC
ncbi:MAG TPA: lanthionine synthetase LanC family protein [Myxococcales bacterium]